MAKYFSCEMHNIAKMFYSTVSINFFLRKLFVIKYILKQNYYANILCIFYTIYIFVYILYNIYICIYFIQTFLLIQRQNFHLNLLQ